MEFNLTSSQLNFYTNNNSLDSIIWNQGVVEIFPEVYSYEKLNVAYNKLVKNHDSLRVRLKDTETGKVTFVEDFQFFEFPLLHFDSDEEMMIEAKNFINTPLDLYGRLIDCKIFQTPTSSGIMICAHHIVVDGYSAFVMADHINKYLKDSTFIPDVCQRYEEYIGKEEKHKNSKRFVLDRDFWTRQFSTNPVCSLVSDQKTTLDFSGEEVNVAVSPALIADVRAFCEKNDITVTTFFNTVYASFISIKFDVENFTIGVPVLNRTTQAEMNMVGLYMHIVPLVISLQPDSFIANAQRIQDSTMNLFRHQKFTQHDIKELLKANNKSNNTLFDVVTDYLEFKYNEEYHVKIHYGNYLTAPLEFHLQNFNSDEYNLKVLYRTAFFGEKEVRAMISSIFNITKNFLAHPDRNIFNPEMLSVQEKHMLLHTFNDTFFDFCVDKETTLYSIFEKTAKENAEKVCITTAEREVTFGELLSIAESLDREIQKITKGEKCVISVIAQRSPEMYAAIYGIIRGGNAYLPISDDYPRERIEYILKDSNAKAVVAQDKFVSLAGNTPCIDMTRFISSLPESTQVLPCEAKENDTAYVIYTSGSTGNPKGARVSHKSAVNRILWMHEMYPLKENDVILQKTPYTFDVSVWELFWWGMCGGKLAASKPQEHFLPAKILDEVHKNKVTHLHFVPSVFELFLNYLEAHTDEKEKFNSVRYVFLSGEALSAELITRFYALYDYNRVGLHNLYGPTECAVDVTYYPCKPTDTNPVPIGKPIYNTQIHIVDKHMNLLPVGVKGELCIGGVNVGQGYLNNEELTAEKFVDNPFGAGKLYKTGDLAYWREDGEVIFCGRIDSQIKLNGQRIELEEIESVLSKISGIDSNCVIVKKINGNDVLTAFYCGENLSAEAIRSYCEEKLPVYMVPAVICRIDEMPLNANGKLDKKVLNLYKIELSENTEKELPLNDTERLVCDTFAKILELDFVGRRDNFFSLGGTSISMISVLSDDAFKEISSAEFIANPTPAKLAVLLLSKSQAENGYIKVLYESDTSKKLLCLVPYAGGGAEAFAAFVKSFTEQTAEYSICYFDYPHCDEECFDIAEELKKLSVGKELYFYSHCAGSAVTMNIINILESKKGVDVKHYAAGGNIPPEKAEEENFWEGVPDELLIGALMQAGAPLENFTKEQVSDTVTRFREDTDYMTQCFFNQKRKIECETNVIINKKDLFTQNFEQAFENWSKYAENVRNVCYIETDTHYFQADNSKELVKMLLDIFAS